jgi:hypothetical protein
MPAKRSSKPAVARGSVQDQSTLQRSTLLLKDAQTLQKAVAQLRSSILRGRERDCISAAETLEAEVAALEPRRSAYQLGATCSEAGDCCLHAGSLQGTWLTRANPMSNSGSAQQGDRVNCIKQLRQLSEDTTGPLLTLVKYAEPESSGRRAFLSFKAMWTMVRPLLRVILWVLPEHVPDAPATTTDPGNEREEQGAATGAQYVQAVATVSKHKHDQAPSEAFSCARCCLLLSLLPSSLTCHVSGCM